MSDRNAPHFGNPADGSVQLFADQPGGVRSGCGVEPSGVLPPQWKASLRDDGEPIGVVVGSNSADRQMPVLFHGPSRSS
jgi:hypothetical protein